MKEFVPLLNALQNIPGIQRIIPGKISRQQSWSSFLGVTYSYTTPSGLKFMMKKWGTAQELFITCTETESENVQLAIHACIQQYL